jgi:hypothetical protein
MKKTRFTEAQILNALKEARNCHESRQNMA